MISSAELLVILVLFVFYSLIIFGLIIALRRLKVPAKIAIVLGFLIFSVISGLGVVWRWPDDISVMVNFPASSQAHDTIPWILRIPQDYVVASLMFWGLIGLLVQLVRNGWMRTASLKYRHHLPQGRELI